MILFIVVLLLVGTTAKASDYNYSDDRNRVTKHYHYTQPISFTNSGVMFFVYSDGDIDYKILNKKRKSKYNHWNKNLHSNTTPGSYYSNRPYSNFIRYDQYGRLRKVGHNRISYDHYDRARRIGTIIIQYNRKGLVSKIGGLYVYYNKNMTIKYTEGAIHYNSFGYCGVNECTITHIPYYKQLSKSLSYNHDDNQHHYRDRKRKKRSNRHDDDDDDDD